MEIEYDRIMRVENDAREIYHLKAIPFFDKGDWVIGGEEGLGHKGIHFCNCDLFITEKALTPRRCKFTSGYLY